MLGSNQINLFNPSGGAMFGSFRVVSNENDYALWLGAPNGVVQDADDLLQVFLALGAAFGDHARDLLVLVWLQIEERQVLQLPLDGVDAQAVRDGRIDLQRCV